MLVTQVPVADWHARFPDPTLGDAILDRLVHNAYRINLKGESRRKSKNPNPPCSCRPLDGIMSVLAPLSLYEWLAWPERMADLAGIRT